MQSLRLLGRLAPKTPFRALNSRSYSIVSRSYLRPSVQAFKKPSYPAFSTSIARKESAGNGVSHTGHDLRGAFTYTEAEDAVLSAKLENERTVELENMDPSEPRPEVEAFKQNSGWEVVDHEGMHELSLTKSFGNETIKVVASIIDVNEAAEEDEWDDQAMDDAALEDEDYQQPKRTINQSGAKGGPIDTAAEDSIAPSDQEGGFQDDSTPPYPISLTITISKPGNQAIDVRAVAQDGAIQLEEIMYKRAEGKGEDDPTPYAGPPFLNLDGDLQVLFLQYLEERGINAELASIMPTLLEVKEQREYVDWLQDIKKFVDA